MFTLWLSLNDLFFFSQNANVSTKAHNFKDKHFLLIHGTADGKLCLSIDLAI